MASVTPDERRILIDWGGIAAGAIEGMTEQQAQSTLQSYYDAGKVGQQTMASDLQVPLPALSFDWIAEGLARSVTAEGIEFGFRETGKAIETTARQVGVGIQKAVSEASSTLRIVGLAIVVIGIGIVYVKLR